MPIFDSELRSKRPFLKTILPSSYDFDGPLAVLVDVHSGGVDSSWLSKRAAAGVFKDLDLKPERGKAFLHLIAMGDMEAYGLNRNGDGFLKCGRTISIPHPFDKKSFKVKVRRGTTDTHETFTKFGKVFKHHQNKDPNKSEGDIVKSAHNDALSRVELMIKVPEAAWHDDIEKIANGELAPFSMSCRVPFDLCSECGHKSPNRTAYCDHLKYQMGEITKDGNHIGMINDDMLFFDISRVVTGADRIAVALLKAASVADGSKPMSGAELAESLMLFPPDCSDDIGVMLPVSPAEAKLAAVRKLSEIEKEIEATGKVPEDSGALNLALKSPGYKEELSDDDIKGLSVPRNDVLNLLGSLTDAKISLSLRDFLKLVLGDRFGDAEHHVGEAETLLPGMFGRMLSGGDAGSQDFQLGDGLLPRSVRDTINRLVASNSFDDEPVKRRVTIMVIRGGRPRASVPALGKSGSECSEAARRMAEVYGQYKLAVCRRWKDENNVLTSLAVLQHYIGAMK